LRPGPRRQRAEEARAHDLGGWRALRVPGHETINKCLKALEGESAKEEPERDDRAEERRDMIIVSLTHVRMHRSLPFPSEGLQKLSCLLQVRNWRKCDLN
jgi:hypothetical protein